MSEGEEFISIFLENSKIEYRQEQPIDGLQGDTKSYRKADFYLPRYEVYVEYFGQWNNESEKPRYREKRQVYIKNKIPCVILYPENLGIIDFVFYRRIEYVFNRYKMEKQRRKYYFDLIKSDIFNRIIYAFFGIVLMYFNYDSTNEILDNNWFLLGLAILAYQLYKIYKYISDIKKGRNPYEPSEYEEDYE